MSFKDNLIIGCKILTAPCGLKRCAQGLETSFKRYRERIGDPNIPFSILDLLGLSERMISVYKTLKKEVPFGKTITYGELAKLCRTSPRFVGLCMKRNPFPLLIPCHRVVAKGGLGGYSQGLDIKVLLLKHEGVRIPRKSYGAP